MRRLPQSLSGLSGRGGTCLWLGLSRADRLGGDAGADRHRNGEALAERLDLLRTVRGSLPDAHSLAAAAQALAGEGIRKTSDTWRGALRARRLGLLRQTAEALSTRDADRCGASPCDGPQRQVHEPAARPGLDAVSR